MEYTSTARTPILSDIRETCREISPTKAEKSAIDFARAALAEIGQLGSRHADRAALQKLYVDALDSFVAEPSDQTADRLRSAALFQPDPHHATPAEVAIQNAFTAAHDRLRDRLADELRPHVLAWFDRAAQRIEAEIEKTEKAMGELPHMASAFRDFAARADATRQHINEMRGHAEADPFGWLSLELGM
jgi:hypothetical protein